MDNICNCLSECHGCFFKVWNFIKKFFILIFTLKGYVPSNLYTTDFRLLFVLTAIYTSLVTNFRQAGNQETEEDVISGNLFKINSLWRNHSISGGVSDRILWNCRKESQTHTYYETLYLGLLIFSFAVIIAYFIASMIINALIAFAVLKINITKTLEGDKLMNIASEEKLYYLEIVANEIKKAHQLRQILKERLNDRNDWLRIERNKNCIEDCKSIWNDKCSKFQRNTHLYNWFVVLYIIPRIETIIMLCILIFALTSYDIHPLGCLHNIDISYDEAESFVNLSVSENVIRYQRVSAVLIILLFLLWSIIKCIQFLLLPRTGWGIQINKGISKRCYCNPWNVSCIRQNLQKDYDLRMRSQFFVAPKKEEVASYHAYSSKIAS